MKKANEVPMPAWSTSRRRFNLCERSEESEASHRRVLLSSLLSLNTHSHCGYFSLNVRPELRVSALRRLPATSVPDPSHQRCQLCEESGAIVELQWSAFTLDGMPESHEHDAVAETLGHPTAEGLGEGVGGLIGESRAAINQVRAFS